MNLNALQHAAKAGDQRAEKELFEILSVRFRRFVYQRVWNDEAAEEIAQEALAVVAEKYGGLQVHTSFAAWAHRVLENRLLAYIKSKQAHKNHRLNMPVTNTEISSEESDPDLKRRLSQCLRRVARSNRRYARILNLRCQGYSTEEICNRLGITVNNCYVLLSRARVMLKDCLEKDETKL